MRGVSREECYRPIGTASRLLATVRRSWTDRLTQPVLRKLPVTCHRSNRAAEALGDLFARQSFERLHFSHCSQLGVDRAEATQHIFDLAEAFLAGRLRAAAAKFGHQTVNRLGSSFRATRPF